MDQIFKIRGTVRDYGWGGHSFIPQLLGFENTDNKPQAEYWLGAHPSAPSQVTAGSSEGSNLHSLSSDNALDVLGSKVVDRFGSLPFLFKVLDVRDMLSIQVHPSKAAAEKGYADEDAAGIPVDAPFRNYRDQNHKPELMLALSEFWLLHGFKSAEDIAKVLETRPCYAPMLEILKNSDVQGLFSWTITAPLEETNLIIDAVLTALESEGCDDKTSPEYWIRKWTLDPEATRIGLLVILLMNVVKVNEGEAVFQGAGIIHAYLEGQNIEIMANSDNVLRGGLTAKHMDAEELIKHTHFETIDPKNSYIAPTPLSEFENQFNAPIEDFLLTEIKIPEGQSTTITPEGLEIFLTFTGDARIHSSKSSEDFTVSKGDTFAALPGSSVEISSTSSDLRIFRAKTNI